MEPVIASAPSRSLAELETVIERGLSTFVDVGTALAEIRDSRLYRGSQSDFDAYCRDRWGFSRRHSSRLITAAQIAEQLGPVGPIPELSTVVDTPLPTSERQVRELARVVPEQRAETWQAVIEQHGEKPTAEQVRRVVQERYEVPTRVVTPTSFVPGPMLPPVDIQPRPLHEIAERVRADESELLENVADPDDLAMDRMRHQFWHHWKYLGLLIHLQPESIAAVLEPDQPSILRQCFADTRAWMDAIEKAMEPRGLRVVS
jgi:hypothetical protein